MKGVYQSVEIGLTITDDERALWSVDIRLPFDDGPRSIVGNGPTLNAAADDAVGKFRLYLISEDAHKAMAVPQ